MPKRITVDGTVHIFPDEATDEDISAALNGASETTPVDDSPAGRWARAKGLDKDPEYIRMKKGFEGRQLDAETQLSMAGGLAGPVGAGIGGGVGSLLDGKSLGEAAQSAALNFAIPKAIDKGMAAARPIVSKALRRGAVRAMKGALKPDRGYLEKMAGAKNRGIAAMETDIAETALDEGVNPVRRKGVEALTSKIDEADAQRKALVRAAPDAPVARSGRHAETAAKWTLRRVSRGDAPADDIAAVKGYLDDLLKSPRTSEGVEAGRQVSFGQWSAPEAQGWASHARSGRNASRQMKDLTPVELEETIRSGNDRLRGMFGGKTANAELEARKAVQRARTADLDKAAGTGDVSKRMQRLIDARAVGNIATRRAESNNPISLTDIISLSAGRPAVFAGSVGMKAPVLAEGALLMNRAGKSVATPSETADAIRRLLLALGVSEGQ